MTDGDDAPEDREEGKEDADGRALPPRPSSAPPRPSSAPPRPSSAPSRPSLHAAPYGGALRVLFGVVWLAVQITLVLTAGRRPDGAFGFRMFSESSTVKVALFREVTTEDGRRVRVHVDDGRWTARDAYGMKRGFAWTDRVRRRELAWFDTEINASYGAAAQLSRWQAALEDVAAHVPDDAETRAFVLEVAVRRNGREPYVTTFTSAERLREGAR